MPCRAMPCCAFRQRLCTEASAWPLPLQRAGALLLGPGPELRQGIDRAGNKQTQSNQTRTVCREKKKKKKLR